MSVDNHGGHERSPRGHWHISNTLDYQVSLIPEEEVGFFCCILAVVMMTTSCHFCSCFSMAKELVVVVSEAHESNVGMELAIGYRREGEGQRRPDRVSNEPTSRYLTACWLLDAPNLHVIHVFRIHLGFGQSHRGIVLLFSSNRISQMPISLRSLPSQPFSACCQ